MDSGGDEMADDGSYGSQIMGNQTSSMDEVLGQSMPGPSGLQQVMHLI